MWQFSIDWGLPVPSFFIPHLNLWNLKFQTKYRPLYPSSGSSESSIHIVKITTENKVQLCKVRSMQKNYLELESNPQRQFLQRQSSIKGAFHSKMHSLGRYNSSDWIIYSQVSGLILVFPLTYMLALWVSKWSIKQIF